MAVDGESDRVSDVLFPEADAEGELYPVKADGFHVIVPPPPPPPPSSSDSLHINDLDSEKKERAKKKDDSFQTLKFTIVVAGAIVAVIGAAIAISKKLRQK